MSNYKFGPLTPTQICVSALKISTLMTDPKFLSKIFTELTEKYISEVGASKKCRIFLDVSKHVEDYECRLRSFDGQVPTSRASSHVPAYSLGDNKIYNLIEVQYHLFVKDCDYMP